MGDAQWCGKYVDERSRSPYFILPNSLSLPQSNHHPFHTHTLTRPKHTSRIDLATSKTKRQTIVIQCALKPNHMPQRRKFRKFWWKSCQCVCIYLCLCLCFGSDALSQFEMGEFLLGNWACGVCLLVRHFMFHMPLCKRWLGSMVGLMMLRSAGWWSDEQTEKDPVESHLGCLGFDFDNEIKAKYRKE